MQGFVFQSGDVTHYDGRGGESVVGSFGGAFEDEFDDDLKHRGPGETSAQESFAVPTQFFILLTGYLAMANSGSILLFPASCHVSPFFK